MHGEQRSEALGEAIDAGDAARVRALLAAGADPNEPARFRGPPIAIAAEAHQLEIARILLDAGAAPDGPPSQRQSALSTAAMIGEVPIVELLLDRGADPARADRMGMNALHWATWWMRKEGRPPTREGQRRAAELLLTRGADANARTSDGTTALMMAAGLGDAEYVERLLAAGADPSARNNDGETAVDRAGRGGFAEIAALLAPSGPGLVPAIQSGNLARVEAALESADPNAVEAGSKVPPLVWAARLGLTEVARKLLARGARPLGLHEAAKTNHSTTALLLLEAGAEVEDRGDDREARTPLYLAAEQGALELVEALLARGANPDARKGGKKDGVTPLFTAICQGHQEVALAITRSGKAIDPSAIAVASARDMEPLVGALLEAGASPDGVKGRSPLLAAARDGSAAIIRRLLAAGADPTAKDEARATALHIAAAAGRIEAVEALLATPGADLEAKAGGLTPLQTAAAGGYTRVVEILLQRGAKLGAKTSPFRAVALGDADGLRSKLAKGDPNATDSGSGWSLLVLAALLGRTECVRVLLDAGANARSEAGKFPPKTALLAAALRDRSELIPLLLERDAIDAETGAAALGAAAAAGHAATIRALVSAGVAVDGTSGHGATPLMQAAEAGHLEAVRALLSLGADPAIELQQRTALARAVMRGNQQVVSELRAAKPKPSST
jgi:ankyrin repeat protein